MGQMNNRIKKVCVVGAGSAGFLSAVTVKRLLHDLDVTVVYSPNVPVIGVGESTTAVIPRFLHQQLSLDRARFFAEVRPSWKLGIRFEWGEKETSHFNYGFDNVFYSRPDPLRKRAAYYCLEDAEDPGYFSALMDRSRSPLFFSYGGRYTLMSHAAYHIDNRRFLSYLRGIAQELGVQFVEGDVVEVTRSENGGVADLKLSDGRDVSADLYVDCSGFQSLLLGKTLSETFTDYSDALLCDTAVIGSFERDGEILPYTTAESMEHGWCWRIEFDDRVTRGYVHSSQFCSTDEAMREMQARNPKLGDDLRVVKFPSGRYENYWVGNVVAIGNASGFVEPLEATALHLISLQLGSICGALLDDDYVIRPRTQELQNIQFRRVWDDVRDFLALHYKFNHKLDTPFWKHCRDQVDLGGATEVVAAYQAIGPHRDCEMFVPRESIFAYEGYLAMLVGQRVKTRYPSRLTDQDRRDWRAHRDAIRADVAHALPVRESLAIVGSPEFQWPS
jgi:tryptophan halogenase